MVATKVKVVPVALAALLLIGLGVGGFEVWRRGESRGAASSHAEGAVASAALEAAKKGEEPETKDATATRMAVDPARGDPFATGIVVDEAGTPLADVAVVVTRLYCRTNAGNEQSRQEPLRLDRLERDRVATTDARGRFVVEEPVPDLASLVFLKEGFASEEWSDFAAERAKNRDHRVVMRTGAAFRGRVVDRERQSIELARVTVWPREIQLPIGGFPVAAHLPGAPRYSPNRGCQQTASNTNGAFAFGSLARPDFQLSVMAAGYVDVDVMSATLVEPYELTLTRRALQLDVVDANSGATLDAALLVTDGQGTVLERAVPWHPVDVDHSIVGPPGRLYVGTGFGATFPDEAPRWLSAAKDGRLDVELHVVAAGYVGEIVDTTLSNDEEPPHLRVELAPAGIAARDAAIDGCVHGAKRAKLGVCCLLPAHGEPYPEASETLLSVESGDDGRFKFFDLPAARYRLFVRAPGIAPTWVDVDAPAHDVAIELKPAATLEVVVRNHAGAAAANVVVHAQRTDRSRAWYAKTGVDGVALLEGVLAGPLVVGAFEDKRYSLSDPSVCFPIDEKAFTDATVVEAKSGERIRLERTLVERIATRFHFERDDGAPIGRVRFELSGFNGPVTARSAELERLRRLVPVLDARGDATLELDPGEYHFRVSDDGPARSVSFQVPSADGGPIVVRIPVLGEHGTLVGRVVDSVTGKPVAKRKVFAYARRDGPSDLQPERRLTDDDGRFRFDVLPVGPTLVLVHGDQRGDDLFVLLPDPSSPYTYASQECTVVKERETALEFTLLPIHAKDANLPTLDIEVCVSEAAGSRPIAGARIYVSARVGTTDVEVASFGTDADGRARGQVCSAEHYSVSVYGPPLPRGTTGPTYVTAVVPCAPANGVLTVDAALAKTH